MPVLGATRMGDVQVVSICVDAGTDWLESWVPGPRSQVPTNEMDTHTQTTAGHGSSDVTRELNNRHRHPLLLQPDLHMTT